jgi:hypothetical protein
MASVVTVILVLIECRENMLKFMPFPFLVNQQKNRRTENRNAGLYGHQSE